MLLKKNGEPRKYNVYPDGSVFGKLTLLYRTEKRISGSTVCRWRCECGNEVERTMITVTNAASREGGSKGCKECLAIHISDVLTVKAFEYRTKIIADWVRGMHLDEMTKKYDITRQRIMQIVTKYATPEMVDEGLHDLTKEQLLEAMLVLKLANRRRIFLAAFKNIKPKGASK